MLYFITSDVNQCLISDRMKGAIKSYLILNGTVEPEKSVDIHSRLEAYIPKINREEGDYVKPDDLLALLDDTEIRIRHQQARLQLQQSEINLKDEEKNFRLNRELKETDLISEQDFQASETNFQKAKIDFENNQLY
jgi:multidrug efflux pump subunit AcrA (membrane-fusion protein)